MRPVKNNPHPLANVVKKIFETYERTKMVCRQREKTYTITCANQAICYDLIGDIEVKLKKYNCKFKINVHKSEEKRQGHLIGTIIVHLYPMEAPPHIAIEYQLVQHKNPKEDQIIGDDDFKRELLTIMKTNPSENWDPSYIEQNIRFLERQLKPTKKEKKPVDITA